MATVASIVTRERDLSYVYPTHKTKYVDQVHLFVVVHLSDGTSKTVEFGDFDDDGTGTIRVIEGAETIHAMIEAHEFETENGYPWLEFKKWIINHSGYEKTPISATHSSKTFNDALLQHLNQHCKRPALINAVAANAKLELKNPDQNAIAIFNSVKHNVIEKVHQLHESDAVHHTHIFE
ncbi:hypothetical protein HK405_012017 [Cladochytrium tenue]|nr:hypothetical protein HK405_012017 [Cladochytrium tenue]